jgi:hypothetical protein
MKDSELNGYMHFFKFPMHMCIMHVSFIVTSTVLTLKKIKPSGGTSTGRFLINLTRLRHCFTGTGALLAAEHMWILLMTQHADNIWNEGKSLFLFTDHRRCWKCYPSIRKHSSHRQKRFWFPTNVFFQFFFCSRVIAVNFVLQITPEEKVWPLSHLTSQWALNAYVLFSCLLRISSF